MENLNIEKKIQNENKLNNTKIINEIGEPILMHNRSHIDFEQYELGNRNVSKEGANNFGFFFSDKVNLDHYGPFMRSRFLNIENPWDIRDLGPRTNYTDFRKKLLDLGIPNKDLAAYDLQVQDMIINRNKRLGSIDGLHSPGNNVALKEIRMATFNFFDAGSGFYLRKLLLLKNVDGIIFSDDSEMTVVAFNDAQIIKA
jgi:hypothetical protein